MSSAIGIAAGRSDVRRPPFALEDPLLVANGGSGSGGGGGGGAGAGEGGAGGPGGPTALGGTPNGGAGAAGNPGVGAAGGPGGKVTICVNRGPGTCILLLETMLVQTVIDCLVP